MKLSYRNIRLFAILSGSALVLYIIFGTVKAIILSSEVMHSHKATLRSVPIEYLNLFHDNHFTNEFTEISTVRYPVSYFDYDDNKYCIIVTKIDAINNVSLNNLVKETQDGTENIDLEGGHLMISQFKSDIEYSPDLLKASKISLRLNGDSIKSVIRNDTARCYYLKMRGFTVKYDINSPDDLRGIAKSNYTPPALIAFVMRNKSLYFILISDNYNDILPTSLFNRLVL